MKYKILLLICCLFIFSNNSYAENWVKIDNGKLQTHLDSDSILENDNGIFYNIKYIENLTKKEVVSTMQYQKNKLGIVQTVDYEKYKKNPQMYSSNSQKVALFLNKIKKDSVHEHAIKLVKEKLGYSLPTQETQILKEPQIDFNPYMEKLQKDIKKNWNPPKGEESKRVVLLFKIDKNGNLLKYEIKKSSRNVATDNAAVNALLDTAPFDPLPEDFMGKSVDIQFTFDYKVHQNLK